MFDRRSAARRAAVLGLILSAASATAAIRTGADPGTRGPASASAALPDSLTFDVDYAGVGAEGVDQVWRGTVGGMVPGIVTIRMEYAGASADRSMPVWPVNAWLLFSADDLRRSFAAELSGSMNWTTGEMRVTGLVSDGVRRDAAVEQRVRLQSRGLAGRVTVRFTDPPSGVALIGLRARGLTVGPRGAARALQRHAGARAAGTAAVGTAGTSFGRSHDFD